MTSHIALPYKESASTTPVLSRLVEIGVLPPARLVVAGNGIDEASYHTLNDYDWLVSHYNTHRFPLQIKLDPQDTAALLFTSGTTSAPKAAALARWAILNNVNVNNSLYGTTATDVTPSTMPLYHTAGLVLCLLQTMLSDACITLPSESFNAPRTMRSLIHDRCTQILGVPTMLQALLQLLSEPEFARHDFSHLRCIRIGGVLLPPTLLHAVRTQFPCAEIHNIYGMTELSCILTMSSCVAHLEDARQISTVGRALPHTEVRIVARDDPTRTLNIGEKGEIIDTGMVMKRYWKDPIRTAEAFVTLTEPDGRQRVWMRTGDEGMLDADGFLSVTGRIKDIIIRGGGDIYPGEIEDILLRREDLQNAAVVGIPDATYGEVVAAFVVPRAGEVVVTGGHVYTVDLRSTGSRKTDHDDAGGGSILGAESLRDELLCRLARHVIPRYVFWVDALPLTPSGKVEKFRLVAMGAAAIRPGGGSKL